MPFQDVSLTVDIRSLSDNPFQYRQDYTELQSLTESIAHQGLLQKPVIRLKPEFRKRLKKEASYQKKLETLSSGTEPAFELAFGHRRVRALLALAKDDPTYFNCELVIKDLSDDEMREIALTENLQRSDIHPYHTAQRVAEMVAIAHGATAAVAKKLGKTKRWMVEHLRYIDLPEEVIEMWLAGVLQDKHIKVLLKYPSEVQKQALEHLIDYETKWDSNLNERVVIGWYCRKTAQEFEQYFEEKYQIDLGRAKFDLADKELIPGSVDCIACPFNSQNQITLFPEVSGSQGMCTKPNCFKLKSLQSLKSQFELVKSQGHQVYLIDESWYLGHNLQETFADWEGSVLTRDDYTTQLQDHEGNTLSTDGIGIYCNWLKAESFLQQVPIILRGGKKDKVDPTTETWLAGHKRKVSRRQERRQTQLLKEKRTIRMNLAHRLAELPGSITDSQALTTMLFGVIYGWASADSKREFIRFAQEKWVFTNQIDLEQLTSQGELKDLSLAKWQSILTLDMQQQAIRFFLLMGAAEYESSLSKYLVEAEVESGQDWIREEIETELKAKRMETWNSQDQKIQQELNRYHTRMKQVADWDENEHSWFSRTVKMGDWDQLLTLQKADPKFIKNLGRTLGIKFKSGATDDEIIQTFQNYQAIVLEELTNWKALRPESVDE
ncbi:MAG: ParB/RepB/Spo0J family partition protein [Bacteroidota bacterium]